MAKKRWNPKTPIQLIGFNLTNKEVEILQYIAKHGKTTYYELSEKVKIASNKKVLQALSRLEKAGLIEVVEQKQENFMGRKRKYYGLTLYGLIVAIAEKGIKCGWLDVRENLEEWKSYIDNVAKHWSHLLPKVLGKWWRFKKWKVVAKFLVELQSVAVNYARIRIRKAWNLADLEDYLVDSNLESNFTREFYIQSLKSIDDFLRVNEWLGEEWEKAIKQTPEGKKIYEEELKLYDRWINCLVTDSELREYVIDALNRKIKTHKRILEVFKDIKSRVEKIAKEQPTT